MVLRLKVERLIISDGIIILLDQRKEATLRPHGQSVNEPSSSAELTLEFSRMLVSLLLDP